MVIRAGFFRNRGCYVVGRMVFGDGAVAPMILALLNDEDGIFRRRRAHGGGRCTQHLQLDLGELQRDQQLLPRARRVSSQHHAEAALGLHYSTIGFNHVGKVAVMNELKERARRDQRRVRTASGFPRHRGHRVFGAVFGLQPEGDPRHADATVQVGGVRRHPAVLRKYGRVHEINRTGSMLDNIIYYNLQLDKEWFDGRAARGAVAGGESKRLDARATASSSSTSSSNAE